MAIYYMDTSALVKRYRTEKGTEVIDKLLGEPLAQDRFYTSFLSVLELTSSVVRLTRGGQLREKTATEIIATFRRDLREPFRVWPLDNEIATGAVAMVEKHSLKAADALHIATALSIFAVTTGTMQALVSSDKELLDAARASGILALDPQDEHSPDVLQELRAGER